MMRNPSSITSGSKPKAREQKLARALAREGQWTNRTLRLRVEIDDALAEIAGELGIAVSHITQAYLQAGVRAFFYAKARGVTAQSAIAALRAQARIQARGHSRAAPKR
jgi:hypothetical protein